MRYAASFCCAKRNVRGYNRGISNRIYTDVREKKMVLTYAQMCVDAVLYISCAVWLKKLVPLPLVLYIILAVVLGIVFATMMFAAHEATTVLSMFSSAWLATILCIRFSGLIEKLEALVRWPGTYEVFVNLICIVVFMVVEEVHLQIYAYGDSQGVWG